MPRRVGGRHSEGSGGWADRATVHVAGYTRMNGKYVPGHTRSARRTVAELRRSLASVQSCSANGGSIQVDSYTRTDGTYVVGYTRSARRATSDSSSRRLLSNASSSKRARSGHISSYTRGNVMHMEQERQATTTSRSKHSSESEDGVYVHGYTRANGKYVNGHTRSRRHTVSNSVRRASISSIRNTQTNGKQFEKYKKLRMMARSKSGSMGGNSVTSSGGRPVKVRSYTSTNKTPGYKRHTPGCSPKSCGASKIKSGHTVKVDSFTRSDGTSVSAYTRFIPQSNASTTKPSNKIKSGHTVKVDSFTRSDGTRVSAYTRFIPETGNKVKSGHTVKVDSFTRSDGTHVSAYTRFIPGSNASTAKPSNKEPSASSIPTKCYVDNAYNRKLNRVGLPLRMGKVSKSPPSMTTNGELQHCYVNNPLNRRLGRVGKPRTARIQEALEQSTLEELRLLLLNLDFSDPDYEGQQYALHMLEHQALEEKWRAVNIEPSTDLSRLSQNSKGRIINFHELHLERRIGRGVFGEIYAGLWHGTPIAIKKLHCQRISRRRLENFANEITVLAALDHPNTIRMFGAVVEQGNIGIVMEYMHRSLFHAIFVTEEEFSESKKKEIIEQISCAVKYLHNHDPKIAHCDIKSENVLLDSNDNAKLSDFGLSTMKNISEPFQSNIAIGKGTPCYSAPEVLRGELLTADQLLPADIYSLSMVVFEVIVEEEPFQGLSVRQLEVNVGYGELRPTLPAAVSQPVVELLNCSWSVEPSNRPTAMEFHSSWRGIAELYENHS